jgi:hypothetical protein
LVSRKRGEIPRNIKYAEDFYRAGSDKKYAMMRLRAEMKSTDRRSAYQLWRESKDPAKKDMVPSESDKTKADEYYRFTGIVPDEVHKWLSVMAKEKNCSHGDLLTALVDCAKKGNVFHMDQMWTKLEREFYEAEWRKQKRLQRLQIDRAGKVAKPNDRLGKQHLPGDDEIKLPEDAGARHRDDRPKTVPRR